MFQLFWCWSFHSVALGTEIGQWVNYKATLITMASLNSFHWVHSTPIHLNLHRSHCCPIWNRWRSIIIALKMCSVDLPYSCICSTEQICVLSSEMRKCAICTLFDNTLRYAKNFRTLMFISIWWAGCFIISMHWKTVTIKHPQCKKTSPIFLSDRNSQKHHSKPTIYHTSNSQFEEAIVSSRAAPAQHLGY